MAQVIQHLRGTAAQWTTNNIVVPQGELAFLIDGGGSITSIKIGNGIGTYSALPVFDPSIAALAAHVAAADPHTQYLTPAEANAAYSALGHAHVIADVTGLQTALDNKQPLALVLTNTTAAFTTAQETKLAGVATGATANTGTVTSVGGTGAVSGLTLTGTVTTFGSLTLGGALAVTAANFASQTAATFLAAPNGLAGVPTFRTIIAADIPTLNQGTTGSAATLTTGRTIAMTGDVAWTSASFNGGGNVTGTSTIGTNVVTLAKMSQVVTGTFLGRVTAATGDVEALTGTQATTLLTVFTSALKGLAPASGGGTTNFLRADGTWAAPAAGGGPANYQAVTKIAAYTETATSGEVIVAADLVAGFTITLPAAVGNTARLTFKKMQAAGSIVIDANAAETIDGGLTATLTRQYESITIVSDNANWIII